MHKKKMFCQADLHSIICMERLIKVKTIFFLYLETDLSVNYRSASTQAPVIICNAHLQKPTKSETEWYLIGK